MKKTIFTICALLAASSACIAGCANDQPKDTNPNDKEPTRITVQEDGEKKCPDGEKCPKHDLRKHGEKHGERLVKPNFRFEPPAETAPQEDGAKDKAPEKSKESFGKKRRFDKRFKENAPEKKDTPAPEVENDGNVAPKDDAKSDK